MLKQSSIDSLKLRLPREMVRIVDSSFAEEYKKIYLNTGLIDETVSLDKHKVKIENGITSRIGIGYFQQGKDQVEQIIIQANAKQLESNYFHGINKNTVEQLYDYIMRLNIIDIPFDLFLRAAASDTDLAYDVFATPKKLIKANQIYYSMVLPKLQRYVSKPFRQKTNVGLQFNTRPKATANKPFVKIYHKGLELAFKSTEFSTTYLKEIDFQNLGRLEYTIKNSRHKKALNVQYTTLEDLLEVPQEKLNEIVKSGIPKYIHDTKFMSSPRNISSTERMLLYFIEKYINLGADKQEVYRVLDICKTRQERYRMNKKLDELLTQVDNSDRMLKNKGVMDILRDFGTH